MENQHRKIDGYRELNQGEIKAINAVKQVGGEIDNLLRLLPIQEGVELDQRWVAIAKTELQKGLMALTRAIARPSTF